MYALRFGLLPGAITSNCRQLIVLQAPLAALPAYRRRFSTSRSLKADQVASIPATTTTTTKTPKKRVASKPKTTKVAETKASTKTAKSTTTKKAAATPTKKKKKSTTTALKEPATKPTRRRKTTSKTTTIKSPKATKTKSTVITPTATTSTRRPRAATKLLQHQQHYDFNSYLQFLETAGKSTATTVSTGTLYEYATIQALAKLGFRNLVRCGKAGDNGVDVVGTCDASAVARTLLEPRPTTKSGSTSRGRKPQLLHHIQTVFQVLSRPGEDPTIATAAAAADHNEPEVRVSEPPPASPFNVIVQCKASEASVGSYLMREMAGSYFAFTNTTLELRSAPAAVPTMVILVTAGGRLTTGAYKQLEASQMPMVYMYLEKPRCAGGSANMYDPKSYRLGGISQVTPNQYAKELLKQHGLAFKIVRSYSLKPAVIVDQVAASKAN